MTFTYLCCMSSNSVTMPSKLLPISAEHGIATASFTGYWKYQTFLWHFVVNFAQQLFAIVHYQDCMPILCLFHLQGSDLHYGISGSTFVLSDHLYIHLPMLC